jgi:hypothetical protein
MKEFGERLGANVMESLTAVQFDKIKFSNESGKYTEFIRYFARDFWNYMFGQSVRLNIFLL